MDPSQLTPIWVDYEVGFVMVNTAEGRIKHKNVLNDTRFAVSVVANENPLVMTIIRAKLLKFYQIMITYTLTN